MANDFYNEIAKLKTIKRKGWVDRKVKGRVESDMEHTGALVLQSLVHMAHNDLGLDQLKVLKMLAYHELCEIDAGDTTPYDGVSKLDKFLKEYACIKRIAEQYDMPEIEEIWLEFEDGMTDESKYAKKLDKYDAVKQAKIYSDKQNRPEIHEEFRGNAQRICEEMDLLK